MKEEDFKKLLKESILEKAPEGLSDSVMDRIAAENVSKANAKVYSMPGKRLILFLAILFSGSILWALLSSPSNKSRINTILESISFQLPTIEKSEIIFNSINVYLLMAFLAFLFIEFLIFRSRTRSVI